MRSDQSFGAWLRHHRLALDLTQAELARQVGCSAITLRKLEAEERRPSKQIAERLADVLQVPSDDRPAFLRFARGDPFAAPAASTTASQTDQPPEAHEAPRHNLPLQLTSLLGREQTVAAITERLRSAGPSRVRLLSLTGPGGTGKTRLALQVATKLLDEFADGVFFVNLAPLSDPALVALAIAQTIGLRVPSAQVALERLKDHLRQKHLLLLLDNFEQVLDAASQLAELLSAATNTQILVTSRVVLRLSGEQEFPVPPLAVPDLQHLPGWEALTQFAGVALFVQRAQAAQPAFHVTQATAPAVAEICVRLDGLPLAIELAAARTKLLPPVALLARLSSRLGLLTGGARDLPARQQTLRNTIDWSYRLLTAQEQVLFARLAVFVGGWTLQAVMAVCNAATDPNVNIMDGLQALVDHNLVQQAAGNEDEPRFTMLETIREYALERLEVSGEAETMRRQHAAYVLAVLEPGVPVGATRPQQAWLDQMEKELDNLRAALTWSQSAVGGAELMLRLALARNALGGSPGFWSEARNWLEAAVACAHAEQSQDKRLLARALSELSFLLSLQGDYAPAEAHGARSLRLFRELGDLSRVAGVLGVLGALAREQGDAVTARLRLEEGLVLSRELGDRQGIAWASVTLGEVAVLQEDAVSAASLIEEALAIFRRRDETLGIGWALNHLGHVAQLQGDYERARQLHEESLSLFRRIYGAHNFGVAWAFQGLGETALAQGDAILAATQLTKALSLSRDLEDRAGMAWCLAGLAGAAVLDEEPERAARLWGAAEALRQSMGARPAPAARVTHERLLAAARQQLGETAFAAAWAIGQAKTPVQAIELALLASAITTGRRSS